MKSKLARYGFISVVFGLLIVTFQNMSTASLAKQELEGEIEIIHVDNQKDSGQYFYHLKGKSGQRTELKFKGKAPTNLRTGSKVKVKGDLSGNVLALDSSTGSIQVLAAPAPNTFGEQKTAVFLVNFKDNVVQPYTSSQINSVVFGDTNNFMKENSFQQTYLKGSVFGWYTLQITQTCDYVVIRDQVLQTVAAAGVDVNAYNRHIIVLPKMSTCTWAGLGTVGGSPSTAWMNGLILWDAFAHELGHNLGLWHSHSLECGTTTLGSSCTKSEYGDWFDDMGGGDPAHFNAFQKENLGWLNYGSSPAIVTVASGSATVKIEPYAATTLGTKGVKVLKSVDPTTGARTWYYLEYRQAINFDIMLANHPGVTSGPLIHLGTEGNGDSSYLIDMTPASSTNIAYDWNDAPLPLGMTYTDSDGVSLTLLSADSTGATVSVTAANSSTPVCARANPSIAISPAAPSAVAAGTAVTYSVSVKNNDSTVCPSSVFNLGSIVPTGLSASFNTSSLNLAPGASGASTLTVTSGGSTPAGTYNISASAVNSGASAYSASVAATYSVASSCTLANPSVSLTAPTTSAVNPGTTLSYSMTIKNNNSASCAATSYSLSSSVPSGWSGTLANTAVSLVSGASATVTLSVTSPTSTGAGDYTVMVTAISGSQSASASSIYSVATVKTLSVSVTTDKSSYVAGNTVTITAKVLLGGAAASGKSVTFNITDPIGKVTTATATTSTSGLAVYKYKLSRKPVSGTYGVKASAVDGSTSAASSTSFTVP